MDTPICDFIKEYEAKGTSRLHMPGHKENAALAPYLARAQGRALFGVRKSRYYGDLRRG